MSLRFLLREADQGHLQAPADNLSDLPHRYSFFSDRVVPAARFAFLQRKPVKTGNIENMRRRPAIESLANIRRGSLFAGNLDRVGDEALLHGVVDLRKTHYRHVHATLGYGSGRDFRQPARIRVVGIEMIFGCGLTWRSVSHSRSGGDHQWAVRSPERVSESFDGAPVLFTDLKELREVVSAECAMVESTVNHPVRFGCSAAQTFWVFKGSAMRLRSGGHERPGAGVGPRQPEHLMARVDELGNDGRSDKTRSSCKKYPH